MMFGSGSKNKYLRKNKIIIYRLPLVGRMIDLCGCILGVLFGATSFVFVFINIKSLSSDKIIQYIVTSILILLLALMLYFDAFESYICLDVKNNRLIIKDFFKKKEYQISELIDLQVLQNHHNKSDFIVYLNFLDRKIPFCKWSDTAIRDLINKEKQMRRLQKFCDECNKYLNERNNFL